MPYIEGIHNMTHFIIPCGIHDYSPQVTQIPLRQRTPKIPFTPPLMQIIILNRSYYNNNNNKTLSVIKYTF